MSQLQAVKYAFKNFATFHGRDSRSTFWKFQLVQLELALALVALFIVSLIAGAKGVENADQTSDAFWSISGASLIVFGLATVAVIAAAAFFVPNLSSGARRLHDANLSAWWLLLWPFGLYIVLLVMWCLPSHPGQSNFENEGMPRSKGYGYSPYGANDSSTGNENSW